MPHYTSVLLNAVGICGHSKNFLYSSTLPLTNGLAQKEACLGVTGLAPI